MPASSAAIGIAAMGFANSTAEKSLSTNVTRLAVEVWEEDRLEGVG